MFGPGCYVMNDGASQIESFLAVAADYCQLIESRAAFDRIALCRRSFELLSRLIHLATLLPNIEPDTIDPPQERVRHEEWGQIFGDLAQRLGTADGYWMVFDPYDPHDHSSIMTSLADDLADVYRDLKDSLAQGDGAGPIRDDLWNLKFAFETHWGQHAVDAVKALYGVLYGPHSITE